jgi:hypothetical protein
MKKTDMNPYGDILTYPEAGAIYYVHTDHLGSYTLITNANKTKVDSLWFDAWGNRRQYNTWATADTRTSFLFDRGFVHSLSKQKLP